MKRNLAEIYLAASLWASYLNFVLTYKELYQYHRIKLKIKTTRIKNMSFASSTQSVLKHSRF